MAFGTAIFRGEIFLREIIFQMAADRGFVNTQSLGNHLGSPALRSQKDSLDAITHPSVTGRIMHQFEGFFLSLGQINFHGRNHDLIRMKNQASSMTTGICVNF